MIARATPWLLALVAALVAPAAARANGVSHTLAVECQGQWTKVTLYCGSGGAALPCSPRAQITLYACTGCTLEPGSFSVPLHVTEAFNCDAGAYHCSQTEVGELNVPCDQLAGYDSICAEYAQCDRPMDLARSSDDLGGCTLLPWSQLDHVPYGCRDGGTGDDGSGSGCNVGAAQAGVAFAFALLLALGLVMSRRRH